jgi:hypothetical protein
VRFILITVAYMGVVKSDSCVVIRFNRIKSFSYLIFLKNNFKFSRRILDWNPTRATMKNSEILCLTSKEHPLHMCDFSVIFYNVEF